MMRHSIIKYLLLFSILGVLLLPLVQQKSRYVQELPLSGAIVDAPFANFSLQAWWDGSYQEGKSAYLEDHFGFRNTLIRLNNQFDFDVLKKVHANGVVIGREGYLYEKVYIDAYCGVGFDKVSSDLRLKLIKLKRIQDTLQQLGKHLVLVHAPSKAWFYPDKFPPLLDCKPRSSLYTDCIHLEDSLQINAIDFNSFFLKMKDTTSHLLFSKLGIHWTEFGAKLATDSLVDYLKRITKKNLPDFQMTPFYYTDSAHDMDIDIAKGINLYFPFEKERFSYAHHYFDINDSTQKLNAIYIGDSFFWTLYSNNIPQEFNNDYEFWYYFKDIWYRKNGIKGEAKMESYEWQSSINNSDIVILLFTDMNLVDLSKGFIDKAYEHYYPILQ